MHLAVRSGTLPLRTAHSMVLELCCPFMRTILSPNCATDQVKGTKQPGTSAFLAQVPDP